MAFAGLTLRDLEYVTAVAEFGSFTVAAERCAVSQPSLSTQVRKVEQQLGVKIFERAGRCVRITRVGTIVVAQARCVLGEARRLLDAARALQDPLKGPLHLGVIATLAPYLIPHLLHPLRERFPELRLVLKEGLTADLMRDVVAGDVDAVLLSGPVDDGHLTAYEVFFEPFLAIVPARSALAARASLRLADLDCEGLILMDEGHCLRSQAIALCRGDRRATVRHAASVETLRHLVAAGAGHSILPALAVRPDPLVDDLVSYAPLTDPQAGRIIGLAWRNTDPRVPEFTMLAQFIETVAVPRVRRIHGRRRDREG